MGERSLLFNWYGRSMGTNEGERHLGWSDLMDRCRWFTKIGPLLVFNFAECLFTSVYDIFSACIQGFIGGCTEVFFGSLPNWSSEFLWHSDRTFLPSLRDFARLFWNQYLRLLAVIPRLYMSSFSSSGIKYGCRLNTRSSSHTSNSEKVVRCRFFFATLSEGVGSWSCSLSQSLLEL